jgi:hypothetical protein
MAQKLHVIKLSAASIFVFAVTSIFAITGCSGQAVTLVDRSGRPDSLSAGSKARVKGVSIKQDLAKWSNAYAVRNPLKAVIEKDQVRIGDLDQDFVNIEVPEKTLDNGATIALSASFDAPPVINGEFRPLGTPFKIEAIDKDGARMLRTKEPVLVEIKIDKDKLVRNFDRGALQIAYFNGSRWDYIKPSKLDLDNEVIGFRIYHFGTFGYGLVSQDEVIRQYVHRKTLTSFIGAMSTFPEVNIWKFAEIEAAYMAYEDGSKGERWGFNNDAKDFDKVWGQIRGICYQLANEVIDGQGEKLKKIEDTKIDEQETGRIRDSFKKSVRDQFEYRLKNQDKLDEKEVELSSIIYAYKLARLIEPGTFGFDVTTNTVEFRIDELLNLKDKILRDTNRSKTADSSVSNEDTLSIGDLVVLSQLWLSDNGESKYARYIKDEFKIDITQRK